MMYSKVKLPVPRYSPKMEVEFSKQWNLKCGLLKHKRDEWHAPNTILPYNPNNVTEPGINCTPSMKMYIKCTTSISN